MREDCPNCGLIEFCDCRREVDELERLANELVDRGFDVSFRGDDELIVRSPCASS